MKQFPVTTKLKQQRCTSGHRMYKTFSLFYCQCFYELRLVFMSTLYIHRLSSCRFEFQGSELKTKEKFNKLRVLKEDFNGGTCKSRHYVYLLHIRETFDTYLTCEVKQKRWQSKQNASRLLPFPASFFLRDAKIINSMKSEYKFLIATFFLAVVGKFWRIYESQSSRKAIFVSRSRATALSFL